MTYRKCAACAAALWLLTCPVWAEEPVPAEDIAAVTALLKPAEAPKKEPIHDIDGTPLGKGDLSLCGLRLGTAVSDWAACLGDPVKREQGSVRDEYQWDGVAVQFIQDRAYAYSVRPDLAISSKLPSAGAAKICITKDGIKTARGLSVGSSRENVVRVYGRPDQILWDGPQQQFYLIYETAGQQLVFTVGSGRVKAIQLSFAGDAFPASPEKVLPAGHRFFDEEFQIARYEVGNVFEDRPWLIWQKKATNPEEEIWYFPGFGVRMSADEHEIASLFIMDEGMMTRRGVSVGDQLSTVEALYGEPQKLEMNLADLHPQSAYIYFSQDRKTVLIFYINETEKVLQNIVAMKNPQIPDPLQPALSRIRAVRAANHQRAL